MDESMKQFQNELTELEFEAEHLLLARNQVQTIPGTSPSTWKRLVQEVVRVLNGWAFYEILIELVENDRVRNGNREALTSLRKRARTTKSSVTSPFNSIMKGVMGASSRPLVQEVCTTCGNHDYGEQTWMMFPGTDVFASIPFHAAHTIIETDQAKLDFEAKQLQSLVKEKSYIISETGAIADRISPGVLKSLVTLSDKPKQPA